VGFVFGVSSVPPLAGMELDQIIRSLKGETECAFDVERSIFYTVLHRLTEPGSDLKISKWLNNVYDPEGVEIGYQHLLRAMGYAYAFIRILVALKNR
jgi:hypothetical protein